MVASRTVAAPCYVCVIAPPATSATAALDYRPFGDRTLREIFQQAASNASESCGVLGRLRYGYYEIAEDFFFSRTLTREAADRLALVPAAIIDCDVFDTETSAVAGVHDALIAFHQNPGKVLYRIARGCHGCPQVHYPGPLITSELKLIHVLEAHLWPTDYSELMANHVNRH